MNHVKMQFIISARRLENCDRKRNPITLASFPALTFAMLKYRQKRIQNN